jgi:hypothetical protein
MRRRNEMAALLARREREGLSLRELSEETGIPFGTLSWWSWRLRHDSGDRPSEGGFVEVVATAHGARDAVVVRVGNDVELEVPPGTDVTWLRNLAVALRSC